MIKMVSLLKRRPGMSREEFIAYYEANHRRIGEKVLKPYAVHYTRRYLTALPGPITGEVTEPEHDVLMEIWFPDQAAMDAAFAQITQPANMAMIEEDEMKLFDRSRMFAFTVTEYASDMS
jgi:EthD domain